MENSPTQYISAQVLPDCEEDVFTVPELSECLSSLIGTQFPLTKALKTDGVRFRKMVAEHLGLAFDDESLHELSGGNYEVVKLTPSTVLAESDRGTPKIMRQITLTFLATPPSNNNSYILSIYNFDPNEEDVPLIYDKYGDVLFTFDDIRVVIGWVNRNSETIETITVSTIRELKRLVGKFGKRVEKIQMYLSGDYLDDMGEDFRVLKGSEFLDITENDPIEIRKAIFEEQKNIPDLFKKDPSSELLYPLEYISQRAEEYLIGKKIINSSTKKAGQDLERMVLDMLGYFVPENTPLDAFLPDIRHQLLEVKLQKKKTVDLGKYMPCSEDVNKCFGEEFANGIRYLIAVTDEEGIIDHIILMYGNELIESFPVGLNVNFKHQKSISVHTFYSDSINHVTYIFDGSLERLLFYKKKSQASTLFELSVVS